MVAQACALAIAGPIGANAQETGTTNASGDANTPSTVIVTGQRAALKSARDLKQDANQIVDSIQATDIGKLPDVSTVESLQRVAGVQIQRRYGEGGTDYDHRTEPAITIRGITQVRNLIDGRDFFTANGGRAPDLEGLPSELMAGVDVYKNAASNLIEGGIGGVVNIRTRLPFDSKEDINVVTLKSNYYDRIRKYSPAGSGLLSRQFKTDFGRMGFLVNATASETYYRQDAVLQQQQHCLTATVGKCATDPTQAPSAAKVAAYNSMPNKGALTELYVPTSFEMYQDSGNRKRQGLALAYQWEVNKDVLLTAQNLYSNYKFVRRGEYIYGDDKNSDPRAAAGSTWTWAADGSATSGVLSPQIFSSSRFDQDVRNRTNLSAVNVKWRVSDRLRSKTDFAYERANYDADRNGDSIKLYDNESRSVANIPNLNLAFDVRGRIPTFSIVDPANPGNPYAYFGNPKNWYYEWLANAVDRHKLKMSALSQDFDYDLGDGFFSKLHVGLRAADTKVLLRGNWNNTGVCRRQPRDFETRTLRRQAIRAVATDVRGHRRRDALIQASRIATAPHAIRATAASRARPMGSRRTKAAMAVANRIAVSRSAATAATGARVIAHSAMPYAPTEARPPSGATNGCARANAASRDHAGRQQREHGRAARAGGRPGEPLRQHAAADQQHGDPLAGAQPVARQRSVHQCDEQRGAAAHQRVGVADVAVAVGFHEEQVVDDLDDARRPDERPAGARRRRQPGQQYDGNGGRSRHHEHRREQRLPAPLEQRVPACVQQGRAQNGEQDGRGHACSAAGAVSGMPWLRK
ncbi:conserved hypothetical protein [Ricinus communis]|uniref:TonB-dependent receptor plug domain-containing protein n=1 Tax=Ricinus communis TaxID=3988 RepID=B9T9J0_RICCO|nr:conserved hypothetical protein [Ricinus communis]